MTGPSHRNDAAPDALVVRVGMHGEDWTEHVPPAPAGCSVSVSFDTHTVWRSAAAALEQLGYADAGVAAPSTPDRPGALFLVPTASATQRPAWWRALTAVADRVYDPAFGPVRALLRPVLEAHAAPRRDTSG